MIYLLIAVGLSPSGSTHLHTNNTQNNTNNNRKTQITNNVEECGSCPVFTNFTLTFVLKLRKKHEKTAVRVGKTSVRVLIIWCISQNIYIRYFRMSKKSFDELLSVINPYIRHQNTNMNMARRKPSFSVSKQSFSLL